MDSLIPGIESKYIVSWIASQSSSDTKTALDRFPTILMGQWETFVSSIKLYNFDRASETFILGIVYLLGYYILA